ncbi:unnamed protein product [Urochloa decumbens]|uniref:Disease resistance RPP13-like protein 4 n=1 Tax=Urochloa decumbens TaxID=240449 RepID=A0ABC9AXC0_9POAL
MSSSTAPTGMGAIPRDINEDILIPLSSRLGSIEGLLSNLLKQDDDDLGANEEIIGLGFNILRDIKLKLARLKENFLLINKTEASIRSMFDPVERLIDGTLEVENKPHKNQILEKLDLVNEMMEEVSKKISLSYNFCNMDTDHETIAPSPPVPVSSLGSRIISSRIRDTQGAERLRHIQRAIMSLEAMQRGCILCLAAFPEGAIIKKRLLIHWWMGEGFVASATEGMSRFSDFLARGFISPVQNKNCNKIHRCCVQPWMRDLLISLASRTGFLELDSNYYTRARRPCLSTGNSLPLQFHVEAKTIFNIDLKYVELGKGWFAGKKGLRTLQLGQWKEFTPREQISDPMESHIEVHNGEAHLQDMVNCSNLRYIRFRGISRIESLPGNIDKLHNLVILDLRACHNLEHLDQGITKLDMLEYLDVSECHLLNGMPKGLGQLARLEVLKGFVVANSNSKDPCHLHELIRLQELRKLSIRIGKMAVPEEDEFERISAFMKLESLSITWGVIASNEQHKNVVQQGSGDHYKATDASGKAIEQGEIIAPINPLEKELPATFNMEKDDTPSFDGMEQNQETQPEVSGKDSTGESSALLKQRKIEEVLQICQEEGEEETPAVQTKKTDKQNDGYERISAMKFGFPSTLKKLDLHCFPGEDFSEWCTLKSIKKLCITGGKLKTLGDQGDWELEMLRLSSLHLHDDCEKIRHSFLNLKPGFPEICNCPPKHLTYRNE